MCIRDSLELLQITDQIEGANVERMKHLIALAKLRSVTLPDLMQSLGIQPMAHG